MKTIKASQICAEVLFGLNPVIQGCKLRLEKPNRKRYYRLVTTGESSRTLISIYDESSELEAVWVGVADAPQKEGRPLLEELSGRSESSIAEWASKLPQFDEIDRRVVQPNPQRPFSKVFLNTRSGSERFARDLLAFIGGSSPQAITAISDKTLQEIRSRQGQYAFRNRLLTAYGGVCAMTGCEAEPALEAAHIRPYADYECHDSDNGLLLRADIHTLFDLFLISIDPTARTITVHPGIKADYGHLEGRTLTMPVHPSFSPNQNYLVEHNERFKERLSQLPRMTPISAT